MGHRRRREPIAVTLTLPPEPPTPEEIDHILMAADEVVGRAGRTGLALILKGSRSEKVLAQEWDQVEDFGALSYLSVEQITLRIDWCIHKGWLRLEYYEHVPLVYHSEKGLERVKRLWVERLLKQFEEWLAAKTPEQVWPRLEPFRREIKFMLLDRIAAEKRHRYIPILRAWFPHEVRKVRERINRTLSALGEAMVPHPASRI